MNEKFDILKLYVNDIFLARNYISLIKKVKTQLSSNFEMKDLGKQITYLGLRS